jgi:RNA polymerase sigma-70 factor (ECF subfamily)
MLGSLAEAEDVVQQSMLRAWQGLPSFEGRAAFRTWLYRIATHACLDALGPRPMRSPEELDPCPASFRALETPDATIGTKQSVALAFVTAVQRLPPLQRAILLLHEVVGMTATEVAELLDTSTGAVNSALQRARATLAEKPARVENVRAIDDPEARALVTRYVRAWEAHDAKALVEMLRQDAVLTMPPATLSFAGREAIAEFLGTFVPSLGELRIRIVEASGGIGVAGWVRTEGDSAFRAYAIQVLELAGGVGEALSIAGIHAHLKPELFARFGLAAVD